MSIMRTDYLYRIDEKKNVCFVRKKKNSSLLWTLSSIHWVVTSLYIRSKIEKNPQPPPPPPLMMSKCCLILSYSIILIF